MREIWTAIRTLPAEDWKKAALLALATTAAAMIFPAAAIAQALNVNLGTGAGNPGVSTGNRDTALGEQALASNTSGSDNTAVGSDACLANTIGSSNTGIGSFALASTTTGLVNTAVGSGTIGA